MMVQMIDPKPRERVGDLAAGTCGFGVNAYQHVLDTKHEDHEALGTRLGFVCDSCFVSFALRDFASFRAFVIQQPGAF